MKPCSYALRNKKLISTLLLGCSLLLTSCKPPLWFIEDDGGGNQYKDRQQLVFTHLWQRGSTNYTEINNLIKAFNETEAAKELNVYVKGDGINFWDYWTKVDLSILRNATYEILFDRNIPKAVAINEAVELAKIYCDEGSPRFINGCLGRIANSAAK